MSRETISKSYFEKITSELMRGIAGNEYLALDLYAEDSQFIRFNTARVRQLGTVEDASVRLRFHHVENSGSQRTNSAAITLTGDAQRDIATAKARVVRLREECKTLPLDPYAQIPEHSHQSSSETQGKPLAREIAVEKILKELRGLDFTGLYSAGDIIRGMADSRGQLHWFRTSNFLVDYSIYGQEERSYKGYFSDSSWSDEKFSQEMGSAREKLVALENPVREVPRGAYRTYLAPGAVADLVGMIADGPSEMAIRQGDSAFRFLRDGKKKFSPLFHLKDDFTTGYAPRFNEQGELAPEYFSVIEAGELKQTLISARTAKEFGLKANGASRSESLRAPVMGTGTLAEADAAKALDTGLYISNLHYLNFSDQQGGRITGMTRFACFWVEAGKLKGPIKNLRWDDEIFRLFGSELEAVTKESQIFPDPSSYEFRSVGAIATPGVLLRSMQFTL